MLTTEQRRAMHKPGHHTQQDIRTLGILFFMEAHRRILGGRFGSIPTPIKDWAFAEGGYCIDAPDVLPAGGCEFFSLDPAGMEDSLDEFGHFGLPQQLTVPREPDDTAGVATRHPRCGYPYCACVGQCFAASQPGAADGVKGRR